MRIGSLLGAVCVALALVPAAGARAPRATMIGDSVADEIVYSSPARALLRGVQFELAACRRLVQPSCSVDGIAPPTTVALVASLGRRLGPTVVVGVGYNDPALLYARNIDLTVRALRREHVQRIFWLTLRAARHPYLIMNDAIRAAATRYRGFRVVDWNRYSRSHPAWFRDDGVHLTPAGAVALARLVDRALTSRE